MLADLGLAFSLLLSPLGIVLAALALRDTARGIRRGRPLAVTALVVSTVVTVVGACALALVAVGSAASSGTSVRAASDRPRSAPAIPSIPSAPATAEVGTPSPSAAGPASTSTPEDDVTITSAQDDPAAAAFDVHLVAVNPSGEAVSYLVTLEMEDASGTHRATGDAVIDDVLPHEVRVHDVHSARPGDWAVASVKIIGVRAGRAGAG